MIIPSDSPSIYDLLTTAQGVAIVRPNNPPPGVAGYLFDFNGDEEFRFRSIITKHYTEAGTPVSDQIALEPEEVTLKGIVAELSTGLPVIPAPTPPPNRLPLNPVMSPRLAPGPAQSLLQRALQPLKAIGTQLVQNTITGAANKVTGAITTSVTKATNKAFSGAAPPLQGALSCATASVLHDGIAPITGNSILGTLGSIGIPLPGVTSIKQALLPISTVNGTPSPSLASTVDAVASFTTNTDDTPSLYQYYRSEFDSEGLGNSTKQADAAAFFYQLWLGRALFSVETAFGILNNVAILDGRCLQEAETRERSQFTLVFQKVRITGDASVQLGQLAGRAVFQANSITPNGIASQATPTPDQQSTLFQPFNP
jgi:hypothetical protein